MNILKNIVEKTNDLTSWDLAYFAVTEDSSYYFDKAVDEVLSLPADEQAQLLTRYTEHVEEYNSTIRLEAIAIRDAILGMGSELHRGEILARLSDIIDA